MRPPRSGRRWAGCYRRGAAHGVSRERAREQPGRAQVLRKRLELRAGTSPPQLLDRLEEGLRRAQRGEVAKQHRGVVARGEGGREAGRAAHRDVPVRGVERDRLDVAVARQHRGARLRAPALEAGEAVGAVAGEREVVGDRRGWHAEAGLDGSGVAHLAALAVELHDLATPTHCPRSLSGVAITTRVTSGSSAACRAAEASPSSASRSTIGQTRTPIAVSAASSGTNCARIASSMPELVL